MGEWAGNEVSVVLPAARSILDPVTQATLLDQIHTRLETLDWFILSIAPEARSLAEWLNTVLSFLVLLMTALPGSQEWII